MNAQNPLIWHETTSGTFERDIDEAEQFYSAIAKTWESTSHTYFAITAGLRITATVPSQETLEDFENRVLKSIQYAWKKIRLDHPTLAAPVHYDSNTKKCTKIYKALKSVEDLTAWVDRSLHIVKTIQSGHEFANTDPLFECATLWILNPPSEQTAQDSVVVRDLVFRCSHDIIDGIGTLKLFNNLLNYISQYTSDTTDSNNLAFKFGEESKNLSPPLRVAAGFKPPTPEQLSAHKEIVAAKTEAQQTTESIGFPITIQTQVPGRSKRAVISFSTGETSRALQSCRKFGVTATHLIHAAIAIALQNLQLRGETSKKVTYIAYSLINLRSICDETGEVDAHPVSVRQTASVRALVVDLTIPSTSDNRSQTPATELLAALKQVNEFYKSNIIDEAFINTVPLLFESVTPPYPESQPAIPPPNPLPMVSLSSMGLIDKLIKPQRGTFVVADPWVVGSEYSTGLGLFLGTFDGVMSLHAAYNEAFHQDESIRGFLEDVMVVALQMVDAMG